MESRHNLPLKTLNSWTKFTYFHWVSLDPVDWTLELGKIMIQHLFVRFMELSRAWAYHVSNGHVKTWFVIFWNFTLQRLFRKSWRQRLNLTFLCLVINLSYFYLNIAPNFILITWSLTTYLMLIYDFILNL